MGGAAVFPHFVFQTFLIDVTEHRHKTLPGNVTILKVYIIAISLNYFRHVSGKSFFRLLFWQGDGSKYHNTHDPLPPFLWRRRGMNQNVDAAVNKMQRHSC